MEKNGGGDASPIKAWNPRPIDSPRLHQPSLTPEQARAIKDYHTLKADQESQDHWQDGRARGRASVSVLTTRPELGYSCKIEGGVPETASI